MSGDFNPERLTHLRERAGLTKEQLASACGVTRRAVTDWESGRVAVPPVRRLAELLNVSAEYFFQESSPEIDPYSVSFRALSTMTARKQKCVLASARYSCQISDWIDSEFSSPGVDVQVIEELLGSGCGDQADADHVSRLLRSSWRLHSKPVRELHVVLESHGVRIFSLPGDAADVDAFSYWLDGRPYIFLNTAKSGERIRFDLAHELGHLVMHKGVSTARSKLSESQANEFAASFLMPAEGIVAQANTASGQLRLSDIMVMKSSWRVSATALVRRLSQLGLILDWQYRTWMVELSEAGYRRGEPGGIHREQSYLLGQVLHRLRDQGKSLGDIARTARVPHFAVEDAFMGLTVLPLRRVV